MNEADCLSKMVPPGQPRPYVASKRYGILQIQITGACDKACINCTQASQLAGKKVFMTVAQFEQACQSLQGYFGVVGVFGGNPALHPDFEAICAVFRKYFPLQQRGLWCNHPRGKGKAMRETFYAPHSNLNVHHDEDAYREFVQDWPESRPFGLHEESRHSPCFVSMTDLGVPEEKRFELISTCEINQKWSALVGVVPGKGLRGYFCEIAYTMAVLHADDPDWPDTGLNPTQRYRSGNGADSNVEPVAWWQLPMSSFANQVRQACHHCGVPLQGYGELALDKDGREQVSQTHAANYKPKTAGRRVETVTELVQLGSRLASMVEYVRNARAPKEYVTQ